MLRIPCEILLKRIDLILPPILAGTCQRSTKDLRWELRQRFRSVHPKRLIQKCRFRCFRYPKYYDWPPDPPNSCGKQSEADSPGPSTANRCRSCLCTTRRPPGSRWLPASGAGPRSRHASAGNQVRSKDTARLST